MTDYLLAKTKYGQKSTGLPIIVGAICLSLQALLSCGVMATKEHFIADVGSELYA